MSPTLTGRFSTTEPSGKLYNTFLTVFYQLGHVVFILLFISVFYDPFMILLSSVSSIFKTSRDASIVTFRSI